MTTTIPTDQEIRAMDGPALTRLAWQLGLEPCDMIPDNNALWYVAQDEAHEWHPHDDLFQAREVFLDRLPKHGWTVSYWRHGDVNVLSAHAEARQEPFPTQEVIIHEYDVDEESVGDEAHGLLLCACLARAAQMREAIP